MRNYPLSARLRAVRSQRGYLPFGASSLTGAAGLLRSKRSTPLRYPNFSERRKAEVQLLRILIPRRWVKKGRREARTVKELSGANLRDLYIGDPYIGASWPIPFSGATKFPATAVRSLARASAAIVSFEPCSWTARCMSRAQGSSNPDL